MNQGHPSVPEFDKEVVVSLANQSTSQAAEGVNGREGDDAIN